MFIMGNEETRTDWPGAFPDTKFIKEGFKLEDLKKDEKYTFVSWDDGEIDLFFLTVINNNCNWLCCAIKGEAIIHLDDWKTEVGI